MLAVSISACAEGELSGSSEVQSTIFPTLGSDRLDGTAATFSNGTTEFVSVAKATEISLWVECSNLSVLTQSYEVSPGAGIWTPGAVSLAPCYGNTTKYDITDSGISFMRFTYGFNDTGNASTSNNTGYFTVVVHGK